MRSNIFIPKRIKVGYQNRSDTYTKQLAYVIYYDQNNKLRKETSWSSWRDKEIEPNDFNNIPTEGFVLNKKVGDYGGWQHRQAYVRVYDPRNFEFEITIENLLYILENTSSIKGKGLEGEFVYGWDGKDLVLIPTSSPDYKEISKYNKIVHNNNFIKAKDLKIGATYLTKDNIEMIYMGKFDYYDFGYGFYKDDEYIKVKRYCDIPRSQISSYKKDKYDVINLNYGKHFWFAYKVFDSYYQNGEKILESTYKWYFQQYKSISKKFILCVDESCSAEYANIYDIMESNQYYSPVDESKNEYIKYDFNQLKEHVDKGKWRSNILVHINSDFIKCEIIPTDGKYTCHICDSINQIELDNLFKFEQIQTGCWQPYVRTKPVVLEEIYDKLNPYYLNKYLVNGKFYVKEY